MAAKQNNTMLTEDGMEIRNTKTNQPIISIWISRMRILLFFFMFALSLVLAITEGETGYKTHYKAYLLVQLFLVLLITLLLKTDRETIHSVAIDKIALITCAGLSAYTLLSDFFVDKQYRFSGIALFVVFLLFGYIWNSRFDSQKPFREFVYAVQLFLIFIVILSLIIKNETVPGRFSGPLSNPSIFALYMGSIVAILLGSLEEHIRNNSKLKIALIAFELLVVGTMLLMAKSMTPLIAVFFVVVVFCFRQVASKKGIHYAITTAGILGVVIISCLSVMAWYARNTNYSGSIRILEKMNSSNISSLLSGRDTYWRRYFQEMNLLGHGKRPFLADHRILPHNALVGMMYWYGVPCVVPYILMMMMAVEKAWRYANTGLKYAAVPFYSIVSFIIMSMADNVEQPFIWLPWIACYLMMAPILVMRVEDIEALKANNYDSMCQENERK